MKRAIFATILCLNIFYYGISANISLPNFKTITTIDGLPSDRITAICQDNSGFIWFGTDNGLARYDGYEIKVINEISTFDGIHRRNTVKSICVDNDNTVWVGTTDGLYLIDPISEKITTFDTSLLGDDTINSVVNDGVDIWIGTNKDLSRYNPHSGEIESFSTKTGDLINPIIRSLEIDPKGNIWVLYDGVSGGSIYDKSTKEFVEIPPTCDNVIPTYTSLFFEDGRTYATTWNHGIYELKYDDHYKNFESSHLKFLKSGIILSIVKDNFWGYYWISSIRGIYIVKNLDADSFDQLIRAGTTKSDLNNESIRKALYSSEENILWFGTVSGGVNKLALGSPIIKNNLLDEVKEISSNTITSILDRHDELWLGVNNANIVVVDKASGAVRSYMNDPWLKALPKWANAMTAMAKNESRNEIWLGCRYSGVWIVKLNDHGDIVAVNRLRDYNDEIEDGSKPILAIYTSTAGESFVSWHDNRLAVYTSNEDGGLNVESLCREDAESGDRYMPPYQVIDIAEGKNGAIFFATDNNGVWRATTDNDGRRQFQQVDIQYKDLNIFDVSSIHSTSAGEILVGTKYYGLATYNAITDSFKVDPTILSRGIESTNSIIEDQESNLWLGTNRGIARYNRDTKKTTLFNHNDGLSGNIYADNAVAIDDNGILYYGGYDGYTTIELNSIYQNKFVPRATITDIKVLNSSVLHSQSKNGSEIDRDEDGAIEQLNIKSGDVNFTIEFSALSHSNPEKNSFDYRLYGYDHEPQKAINGIHSASYSNLYSGHYKFELYAYNDAGVRSNKPLILNIHVHPEWYNSTWAWIIWILLFVIITTIIAILIRTRIRLNNSIKIARIEAEKVEELNSAKLQFFSNVSHELLTPLAIISCGLDDLRYNNYRHDKLYDIISGNINRLIGLTEQILEFRKADTGNLKLQVSQGDIRELILSVINNDFSLLISKKNLTMSVDSPDKPMIGYFDRDKVTKMIYNLLSNAYKYNIEGGDIRIVISGEANDMSGSYDRVTISVSNTGNVIPEEQMENLFVHFYDGAYRQFKTKGFGIGLSLTKDLVDLHKGNISVESNVESGTTFTISIPLNKGSYQEVVESTREVVVANRLEPETEREASPERAGDEEYTILLAEDDTEYQYVISNTLRRKYNVIVASNGREALELALTHIPDIIVSDVVMPEMSGYDLCAAIKQDINISHIPVILLTAKIAVESKIEGLDNGADVYLTKPVSHELLSAQIESLINNRRRLAERFRNSDIKSVSEQEPTSQGDQFLQQAIAIIHSNMNNCNFDQQGFQEALSMTKSTLYRKVKALTNMSPNEFIRHIRLQHARELILNKDHDITIAELSYLTGFNSPGYFSICFKKEFGVTPTQFIESAQSDMKQV